jgi:uncharacterized protein (TIGR03067 family)
MKGVLMATKCGALMRNNFWLGLVVLLVGSWALAAPAPKDAPKTSDPLVGQWLIEKAVRGGKDSTPPPGSTITFKADGRALIRDGKRGVDEENTYTTDATKTPAEIDVISLDKGVSPFRGIYKIEGDTLIVCVTMEGERPKKFESLAGTEVRLITMTRVKSKN